MIFLPKKNEKYLAALRLAVQKSILRRGANRKSMAQLKKIYLAEALLPREQQEAVDIIRFSDALLGASVLVLLQRGVRLAVSFSGSGSFLFNRRLYTALLLTLAGGAKDGAQIRLFALEDRIVIKTVRIEKADRLETLLAALKGNILRERKSGDLLLAFPAEKSDLPAEKAEQEWVYLTDRFSAVNVYLENLNQGNE